MSIATSSHSTSSKISRKEGGFENPLFPVLASTPSQPISILGYIVPSLKLTASLHLRKRWETILLGQFRPIFRWYFLVLGRVSFMCNYYMHSERKVWKSSLKIFSALLSWWRQRCRTLGISCHILWQKGKNSSNQLPFKPKTSIWINLFLPRRKLY